MNTKQIIRESIKKVLLEATPPAMVKKTGVTQSPDEAELLLQALINKAVAKKLKREWGWYEYRMKNDPKFNADLLNDPEFLERQRKARELKKLGLNNVKKNEEDNRTFTLYKINLTLENQEDNESLANAVPNAVNSEECACNGKYSAYEDILDKIKMGSKWGFGKKITPIFNAWFYKWYYGDTSREMFYYRRYENFYRFISDDLLSNARQMSINDFINFQQNFDNFAPERIVPRSYYNYLIANIEPVEVSYDKLMDMLEYPSQYFAYPQEDVPKIKEMLGI